MRAGAPAADVLHARVGLGLLDPSRLKQAALLGDADARAALAGDPVCEAPAFCASHLELERWAPALVALEQEALRRAVLAAVSAWVDACRTLRDDDWRSALGLVVAHLAACREHVLAGDDATSRRIGQLEPSLAWLRWLERRRPDVGVARQLLLDLGQLVRAPSLVDRHRRRAVRVVIRADLPPPGTSQRAAKRASVGAGRVRNAIRRAVAPWLLA